MRFLVAQVSILAFMKGLWIEICEPDAHVECDAQGNVIAPSSNHSKAL